MTELIVALDVGSPGAAIRLVEVLGPEVGAYKLGNQLTLCPMFVETIAWLKTKGKIVMLDTKIRDIPETVREHARMAADLGVDIMTAHLDPLGLDAAIQGAGPCLVLAVGELSSDPLVNPGFEAELAYNSGCGIVASPMSIPERLRARTIIATAGVRDSAADKDDHVNWITPKLCREYGSRWAIVGRPITRAEDPLGAARAIQAELRGR